MPSYHGKSSVTYSFAQQSDVWCTIWDQGVEERLGGCSDSCLRVIWRAEGWEDCKPGDVRWIGMLFRSCDLYHFLPVIDNRKLNEDLLSFEVDTRNNKCKRLKQRTQKVLTPYLYQLVLVCWKKDECHHSVSLLIIIIIIILLHLW